jgi:hypothetical protein
MPGLEPGIHVFRAAWKQDVDGRDKPGHDELLMLDPSDRFTCANAPPRFLALG